MGAAKEVAGAATGISCAPGKVSAGAVVPRAGAAAMASVDGSSMGPSVPVEEDSVLLLDSHVLVLGDLWVLDESKKDSGPSVERVTEKGKNRMISSSSGPTDLRTNVGFMTNGLGKRGGAIMGGLRAFGGQGGRGTKGMASVNAPDLASDRTFPSLGGTSRLKSISNNLDVQSVERLPKIKISKDSKVRHVFSDNDIAETKEP